jgi:hypothetical protein
MAGYCDNNTKLSAGREFIEYRIQEQFENNFKSNLSEFQFSLSSPRYRLFQSHFNAFLLCSETLFRFQRLCSLERNDYALTVNSPCSLCSAGHL